MISNKNKLKNYKSIMEQPQKKEKQLLNPEKNQINISLKKPLRTYILVAKLILRKFGDLEISSLGNASQSAIKLAEILKSDDLATIEKIQSDVVSLADKFA